MNYAHPPPTQDVALVPAGMPATGPQPPALPRWACQPVSYWQRLQVAWLRCGYDLGSDGRLEYRA